MQKNPTQQAKQIHEKFTILELPYEDFKKKHKKLQLLDYPFITQKSLSRLFMYIMTETR